MAHHAAKLTYFGRFLLFIAIFVSSSLAPLLSHHLSLHHGAEMDAAPSFDKPLHAIPFAKKFGKQLRLAKKVHSAVPSHLAAKRLRLLAAGIAALLYHCVRILLRHSMLLPIKFTSSYVDRLIRNLRLSSARIAKLQGGNQIVWIIWSLRSGPRCCS